MENARLKAVDVVGRLGSSTASPVSGSVASPDSQPAARTVVISADTVVVHKDAVLEKPTVRRD